MLLVLFTVVVTLNVTQYNVKNTHFENHNYFSYHDSMSKNSKNPNKNIKYGINYNGT